MSPVEFISLSGGNMKFTIALVVAFLFAQFLNGYVIMGIKMKPFSG